MSRLATVERTVGQNPDAAVIWLHGLGADGHDFEPLVPELRLPERLSVRFVFPHAPVMPVTLNGGYRMRSWFDLHSLQSFEKLDLVGIRESAAAIEELIAREIERGIEARRIVLAGFSQGGALALYAGLRYSRRIAGIVALSTFLPYGASFDSERSAANVGLPVFLAHGLSDQTVNHVFGQQTKTWLSASGYRVEFHGYPMAHSVCPEEVTDIRSWLLKVLA